MSDLDYIRAVLIPQVVTHMEQGAAHYGPRNHHELGLPGQYADIWRKVKPLKRALWDGDTTGMKEQPREICLDLIGHCLLTISLLDKHEVLRQQHGHGHDHDHGIPIIPPNAEQTERLKAAGWTEENGVWHAPTG